MDEQIFHLALKRIRWSTDRDDLAAAMRTTLSLLLRRPGDQKLLSSLLVQTDIILERHPLEVRQAAVRCVVLLQSAKRGRLTRAAQDARDARRRQRRMLLLMGAAAATVACCVMLQQPP